MKNSISRKIILLCVCFGIYSSSLPQNSKVSFLIKQSKESLEKKSDSALFFALKAVENAKSNNEKYKAFLNTGNVYYGFNELKKAIANYKEAYSIAKIINKNELIIEVLEYLGFTCVENSDYIESKEYYSIALKIALQGKPKNTTVKIYLGLGTLYYSHQYRDLKNSELNFQKALQCATALKDTFLIARSYEELASVSFLQHEDQKAMARLNNSLKFYNSINNGERVSYIYKAFGDYYYKQDKNDSSIYYYSRAFEIRKKNGTEESLAVSATDLASMYAYTGDTKKYMEFTKIALEITRRRKSNNLNEYVYLWLSDAAEHLGRMKDALDYHKQFFSSYDSTNKLKKSEDIIRKSFQDNLDKKLQFQKTENDKQIAVAKEKEKQQKKIIYIFIIAFSITAMLLLLILRAYNKNKKQKLIIAQQRDQVTLQNASLEEKNKEIMDSIHYAKRIQLALLPNDKQIDKILKKKKN